MTNQQTINALRKRSGKLECIDTDMLDGFRYTLMMIEQHQKWSMTPLCLDFLTFAMDKLEAQDTFFKDMEEYAKQYEATA